MPAFLYWLIAEKHFKTLDVVYLGILTQSDHSFWNIPIT